MNRRTYLTGVATTLGATAGCLSVLDAGHTQASADAWDMTEVPTARAYQAYGSVELAAGEFAAWRLDPPQAADAAEDIQVMRGDPIDVAWLPETEWGRYRSGEDNITGYTELSDWKITALQQTSAIRPEPCYVVIDNSDEYGAVAGGDVVVSVDIELDW